MLDTNVLLSAVWKPGGNEARVVGLVREGQLEMCVSAEVIAEYRDVLLREKFAACHEAAHELLKEVAARGELVTPRARIAVCKDPDDDRLLECAAAAGASYLVTGNLRDFPAEYEGVRVLNARLFLEEAVKEPLLD